MLSSLSKYLTNAAMALQYLAAACLFYWIGWVVYARTFHPLSRFPGPYAASISKWWYFLSARLRIRNNIAWPLHRKYGNVVRVQPNGLSLSDPRAIDVVFGTKPKWQKTEFYDAFNPHIEGATEIFSLRDEQKHVELRRNVGHLWTVAAMTEYEPRFDRIVELLRQRLDIAAQTGQSIVMERLVGQYSLDVLGEIFYGKEGGFGGLQHDIDYKNWTAMLKTMVGPLSVQGYAPAGFKTIYVLSQLLGSSGARAGLQAHRAVIEDAATIVRQRVTELQALGFNTGSDMVSKLLAIANNEKDSSRKLSEADVTAWVYDAIMAGFDTTAIAMAHLIHSMLTHPAAYVKLRDEVLAAFADGTLGAEVRYLDCLKLPYLNACIRESSRFTPAGSLGFPRHVPSEGATLPDGTFLPGGCTVWVNQDCVHRDPEVFGEHVDEFRPERWLAVETEASDVDRVKKMERYSFGFGAGSRMCVGRHLANMEIYKVMPALMRDYEMELVGKVKVTHEWFKTIQGLDVRITRRP